MRGAQAPRNNAEIPSLTGLRGVAALLVVVGHFSRWTVVAPRAEAPAWIGQWAGSLPGVGMSIFFTLSGFVIALSCSNWDWRGHPGLSLVRLFFYQFARLYPTFLLFAIVIILRSPALRDLSDPQTRANLAIHLLLWQSWLPIKYGGVDASTDWFHVSWSISTECGLYLLFGLGAVLAAMLPAWRHKSLVLGVAFFSTAFVLLLMAWMMGPHLKPAGWADAEWPGWLFYLSPWGICFQFGMGVAAYRISRLALSEKIARIASGLGAAGLISVYLLCVAHLIQTQVSQAVPAALSTALLMTGSRSPSMVNRLLSRPGILHIGTISYSLYLFHFVVPSIGFSGNLETFGPAAAVYSAINFALSLALAIMLATGIYRLVEVPGRRTIRAAADRLLGVRRPAPVAREQGAPAE